MKTSPQIRIVRTIAVMLVSSCCSYAEPSVSEYWVQSLEAETNGDYALALELHNKTRSTVGASYVAQLRSGWLCYLNEDYPAALDFYEAAAGQSSGALSPLYGALNCHVAMLNSSKVIRVAKAILEIDEQNYKANLQLAATYYQDGNYALAAAYYRKLNRLYPEDLAVASGLAWSYLEQGEGRQAKPLFELILMISPDYDYAAQGLAACERIARR